MIFRTLLMAMAVCVLAFSGCVKKPKQIQQAQVPAMPAPAATPKVDTGEVFNEYYKDSKGKKVGKTFSMNGKNTAESYTPEFSENGSYVVQIAAGPSSTGAEEMARSFKAKGYPAYVAEVQNPTPELSGTYYRVRIGGFSALADAKAFGENILRPANYDYWVDLKSNDAVGTGSGASTGYSSGSSTYTPTPSYTPAPAASEPVYTPSTPAVTPDYGATSSSSTTTPSSGTSTYDWSTPATTTPAASEPPAATTPSTGSSWTTEPSTTPATTTPATETPTTPTTTTPSTTTPDTGWGGSWK
jgi:hypothetical protein